MIRNHGKSGLLVFDVDKEGNLVRCPYERRIGTEMFHGHLAALATASYDNRKAGCKVKRVRFLKGHFMVVNT